jgi:magnesium-protoporphyrin O-methyltransferase
MNSTSYLQRRGQIEHYFDRTAAQTWERLTSSAPVSGIRATVRAGRERMRQTLLSWLPADMSGVRLLDAGCGTGALAVEAARRGADVVAVDLSPTLIRVAQERLPVDLGTGRIRLHAGDMLERSLGRFDYVAAMDSLIHYRAADAVRCIATLAERTHCGIVFTYAPRTPLLAAMHSLGRLFPRSDRAPSIEPVAPTLLCSLLDTDVSLQRFARGREMRVASGFYISQAQELVAR